MVASAALFASCENGDGYRHHPNIPEDFNPVVVITAADSDTDTGVFAADATSADSQTFNLAVDGEGSLFPDASLSDVTVEILSGDSYFTLSYTDGASSFTVSPVAANDTSAAYECTIAATIDVALGGEETTIVVMQLGVDE